MDYKSDIVIIGAGAVGVAIAREFAKYKKKVMVVDKRDDVGGDASKSNSSIICSGFDCPPNTLESRLCLASRAMIDKVVEELDIPFKVCGAIMPAVTQEQMNLLPQIYKEAYENQVYDVEYISAKQILEMEPEVNPDVLGGLYIPRDAVIDPFLFVVAEAENAAVNGVEFLLDAEVTDIHVIDRRVRSVETSKGMIETSYVINAAGLFCDEIARMVDEGGDFTVKPRKGQFYILDKNTPCKTSRIIYPIPTPETRGKLLLQTIHGNMLLGPTAEDLEDKDDHSVTAKELEERRAKLIRENPLYGRVICRCETVTEAEIVEAIRRPVGAKTVDAVKRRVRAGTGRCQGGFCAPKVIEILARELGIPVTQIRKNLIGSDMLSGMLREEKEVL